MMIEGEDQVLPVSIASKYLSHEDMAVRESAFVSINKAYETIDKSVTSNH